VPPQSAGGET